MQFTASLPNSSLIAFVWQVFAFEYWHEFTWHLVGFWKRCELVLHRSEGGLDDWFAWLVESDLVQWLIIVAVVAGLHLRLQRGVIFIRFGSSFVDESGFNRWSLLGVLWSAVNVSDVWNRRSRLFTHNHHRLLKCFHKISLKTQLVSLCLLVRETQDEDCSHSDGGNKTCKAQAV